MVVSNFGVFQEAWPRVGYFWNPRGKSLISGTKNDSEVMPIKIKARQYWLAEEPVQWSLLQRGHDCARAGGVAMVYHYYEECHRHGIGTNSSFM